MGKRIKVIFKILLVILVIMKVQSHLVYSDDQYKLLDYDAWLSGKDEEGNDIDVMYKPYPIIFVHGFASGSPETWKNVIESSYLKNYYSGYKSYELNQGERKYLVGSLNANDANLHVPYLEVMNMQDPNGSIDRYNEGDEIVSLNPDETTDGWADKLAKSIDAVLKSSGAEKVILVCHSMGLKK